ncbi:Lipid A biosynthesis acyltransferase [Sterolibacterium denitrificans]|uniref:Lipid A biosynthesis acyltransferase n=1 Tax=Sterolibacterium denitrificans TaxID=157592 RepID=A0A7Z7HQ08_9PROT|nr:lysophospholipid acyltransferase family protein [Sterolibacterium denitrificans]SMB22277.1 Lipid A biosynthesis acyltransferase [Sterolibacterium denitrificans]
MSFLFSLLSRLPLSILHNLGALLGWIVYLASPTYRRHLRENTAQAGPWAVAARAAAIAEAGKGLLELPYIWLRPQAQVIGQVMRVTGWELIEAAWREERGILLLTPHLGCFEITAQYYGSFRPITVLYRPPKLAWLQPLMEKGRGTHLKLAPADLGGVRSLMKALRRKEAVGMLPDQVPGRGEGIWAPFFGKPAYTMTLAARLAESDDVTVLLIHAERLAYGAGYHVVVQPLGAPLAETLEARVAQFNAALESLIETYPEQYLWSYNRYKAPAGALPPGADAGAGA